MLLSEVTNALVVFAHCDDAEWFFGGTVARLVAQGAEVNYVVCTDGSSGGVDLSVSDAELAATRAAEQRAAADVLGVGEVVFLGYHNDELDGDGRRSSATWFARSAASGRTWCWVSPRTG